MACPRCAIACSSSASGTGRDSPSAARAPRRRCSGLEPYRTAWDAIGDVSPAATRTCACGASGRTCCRASPRARTISGTPTGAAARPLFGWRRRYWSFLLKLAKDRPSWTIQAQPGPATGPFHWQSRLLTIRELCRLQTFPDDVTIVGSRQSAVRQVGNAVPSLLAEVIGRALLEQAFGIKPKAAAPTLLPPRRGSPPPPEPVADVPAAYRGLIGKHAAHPGTGRGYGAERQKRVA